MLVRLVPFLCLLNVIILPLAALVVLRRIVNARAFLAFTLVAAFCVSFYFTYIRKYQVRRHMRGSI